MEKTIKHKYTPFVKEKRPFPAKITNLTATDVTDTTAKLNFTPITALYYEVRVNGVHRYNVTASGQILTGLPSGTNLIDIRAINANYIGSVEWSNQVSVANTVFIYDADFQANVIDEITLRGWTMPSVAKLKAKNDLVLAMKANGSWATIKTFADFAWNNPIHNNVALIDWKRKGVLYSAYGGLTYTERGYKGNGVNGYIDTNFNMSGLNINNFNVNHRMHTDYSISTAAIMGCSRTSSPTSVIRLTPRNTATNVAFASNDATNTFRVTSDITSVSYGRSSSTTKYIYRDGLSNNYTVNAIAPIVDFNYCLNAYNQNGTINSFCDGTIMKNAIGDGITLAQNESNKTAYNNCLTAIGL